MIVPEPCGYAILLLIAIIQKTVPCGQIQNCILHYLTVFETDLPLLGNMELYSSQRNEIFTRDANGVLTPRQRMAVQVRLVRDDNSPLGDWIDEDAVVKRCTTDIN